MLLNSVLPCLNVPWDQAGLLAGGAAVAAGVAMGTAWRYGRVSFL